MSLIADMVAALMRYHTLPHHTDAALADALAQIQAWQRARIHLANAELFTHKKTAPLATYLIDRIYSTATFEVLAAQLLTAGQNALNGSGKLEKLVPTKTLTAGLLGVSATITAIELDLQLAQRYLADFRDKPINDATMSALYQAANAKDARIAQIREIEQVCQVSYQEFDSFLLRNAFKLAKSTAYANGYQPLYDFISEGLDAIHAIDKIERFTTPFVATELEIIEKIHAGKPIFD